MPRFNDFMSEFDPEQFPPEPLLDLIGVVLRAKLKQRQLSNTPHYLGYSAESFRDPDAFQDIRLDCYLEAILKRHRSLKQNWEDGKNVDGYVHVNISNFLSLRQQMNDPVGYATFKNLEAALKQGIEAGIVAARDRDSRAVRNKTVIDFIGRDQSTNREVEVDDILSHLPDWHLLASMNARICDEAQEILLKMLGDLAEKGVRTFRVGHFADLLQTPARKEFKVKLTANLFKVLVWEKDDGDEAGGGAVPLVEPDLSELELAEAFDRLIHLVNSAIDVIAETDRRTRVGTVFKTVVEHVRLKPNERLTQAEICNQHGWSKSTVSDDFQYLRQIVRRIGE